jgi:hypothetical protein
VQRTLDAFRADANHLEADWQYKPPPRLAIDVSKPLLHRALRVLDALLKAFERRDWKVTVSRGGEDRYKPRFSMWVQVIGLSMYFALREPTGMSRNAVIRDAGRVNGGDRKLREERTGRLELVIYRGASDDVERRIGDTDDSPLEARLNEFMIELVVVAHARWEEHQRRLVIWQREEAERKRQAEERRRLEDETARGQALERQALDWALSVNLRRYVAAMRSAVSAAEGERSSASAAIRGTTNCATA